MSAIPVCLKARVGVPHDAPSKAICPNASRVLGAKTKSQAE